jgi:hypothetical protein
MTQTNIKFEYLYRDAGNYKVFGYIVFSNPENLNILEIQNQLKSFEFFDPKDLKIPRLGHADVPYDPDLDHSWNEYHNMEKTTEAPTDKRSIREFMSEILKLKEY